MNERFSLDDNKFSNTIYGDCGSSFIMIDSIKDLTEEIEKLKA